MVKHRWPLFSGKATEAKAVQLDRTQANSLPTDRIKFQSGFGDGFCFAFVLFSVFSFDEVVMLQFCQRRIGLFLLALVACGGSVVVGVMRSAPALAADHGHEQAEPVRLFNGKDFTGWKLPESNRELGHWRVEGAAIVCQSDPSQRGSILWTEASFEDFVLELDFKMGQGGDVDSGVFLRTPAQQVQIGVSGSLKRDMTGSFYVPGKGYPGEAEGVKELLRLEDWNQMKIKAVGDVYDVWLNGQHVFTFRDSDKAVERGPIGFQLHGNKLMTTWFKNIRMTQLPR